METLERCFNERIDKELSNFIDTVEDKIQIAFLTAFDNIVAPKIALVFRPIKKFSGCANSERWEHVGINALFENASENNNILHASNVNDETRHSIPDELSELSVPETHFDRQAHTHHMVTGNTAQTDQIPEFLTERILTRRNPQSHQHQKMSTQVSEENNLPMVEQTPRNQNSDANNSVNCLADAIAGTATNKDHKHLQWSNQYLQVL